MSHPSVDHVVSAPSREQLLHWLYEAAELEHNLMCTYLYAAFSLRDANDPGLSPRESEAVARFRATTLRIAIEEMGHLAAVWNITSALGGAPAFGRDNFPLDPGSLPAGVVVKLAPFSDAVLQHFIFLERPHASSEPDGEGFAPELQFHRGDTRARLTPMATDYDTVGDFYACLSASLSAFVDKHGESAAFCGDPALQLSASETSLLGIKPVICSKTALAAFDAIVAQGEGASADAERSHFRSFVELRSELRQLMAANPAFRPAYPAAVNPVLRRPLRPEGRVWIEDAQAAALVDCANTAYMLMLRLLAYAYLLPRPLSEKSLAVDLSVGLMRAASQLAEAAVRRPAGPSNPECHAGMSFTALRDAGAFPPGSGARRFFLERFEELTQAVGRLAGQGEREQGAAALLTALTARAQRGFDAAERAAQGPRPTAAQVGVAVSAAASGATPAAANGATPAAANGATPAAANGATPAAANGATPAAANGVATPATSGAAATTGAPPPQVQVIDGVEHVEGKHLQLLFESKRCIHARFCVTGAPKVFLANVQGPWIHRDAMPVHKLVEIAHACPSGAIRYRRKDAVPDEDAPPVNLASVRENGPYAVRAEINLEGRPIGYRATLCRCGASKNKPYCDGSHHEAPFLASGEPTTGIVDMLPVRDGPLEIEPEINGPLVMRGNLEILSGTGRAVARVTAARLCRCGGSATKPFCDGTHARIGFKSL
jgi:CDGSH-type Zn-finger protein/uncharacterized Fe-S cluster protein YjdI